jgi:hypothetical protein
MLITKFCIPKIGGRGQLEDIRKEIKGCPQESTGIRMKGCKREDRFVEDNIS